MAKYDYDDVVLISTDAPSQFHPGEKAWVIAIFEDRNAMGLGDLPDGPVYSVEFEGGLSVDVPELWLNLAERGGDSLK